MAQITVQRYQVEHVLIPNELYGNGARFLSDVLANEGRAIQVLYATSDPRESPACPYSVGDFSVECLEFEKADRSLLVVEIAMPKPTEESMCRTVYLCYGRPDDNRMYITSELSADGSFCLFALTERRDKVKIGSSNQHEIKDVVKAYWLATKR